MCIDLGPQDWSPKCGQLVEAVIKERVEIRKGGGAEQEDSHTRPASNQSSKVLVNDTNPKNDNQ